MNIDPRLSPDKQPSTRMKGIVALLTFIVSYSSLSLLSLDGEKTENFHEFSLVRSLEGVSSDQDEEPGHNKKFSLDGVENHKRAIAMITFGESAAESPLLERAILSIRRRGEFDGPIVVITDAAPERYEGLFDHNVFVAESREEDMMDDYWNDAPAMKYKRFKMLILDYISMIPELDDVEFVYYMDVDMMLGAPFEDLVEELQERYGIENEIDESSSSEPVSTLFFFKNFERSRVKFFGCGGFFIMNRKTSQVCLDHWRETMESKTYFTFDQQALTRVADQIKDGIITDCKLTVMDLEHFISYPLTNEELLDMMKDSSYTNLIHIFNTGAEEIDESVTEQFVSEVLKLTDEQRAMHKFGKNIITA